MRYFQADEPFSVNFGCLLYHFNRPQPIERNIISIHSRLSVFHPKQVAVLYFSLKFAYNRAPIICDISH